MGTKNNPGDYDCYESAGPDEPMFILLARDEKAPRLVEEWADTRARQDPSKLGDAKDIEARACAMSMRDWWKSHVPSVQPSQRQQDERTIAECKEEFWRCSHDRMPHGHAGTCSYAAEIREAKLYDILGRRSK